MAQQIPVQFDPLALCRRDNRASFAGVIDVSRFDRLLTVLSEPSGEVFAEVDFAPMADGKPSANGRLRARLPIACQRCLEAVWLDIEATFRCGFATSEAVAARMPEDLDVLMLDEDGKTTLMELMEDELLLAMPVFPRHAEGGCSGDVAAHLAAIAVDAEEIESDGGGEETGATRKAFADLGQLLKGKPESGDSH